MGKHLKEARVHRDRRTSEIFRRDGNDCLHERRSKLPNEMKLTDDSGRSKPSFSDQPHTPAGVRWSALLGVELDRQRLIEGGSNVTVVGLTLCLRKLGARDAECETAMQVTLTKN